MKKLLFVLSALIIAGCTVSNIDGDTANLQPKVYTAGFEDVETKVYVDSNLKTHWTADDNISIFTSSFNGKYRFTGETSDISGSFTACEELHSGASVPTVYAVYPYSEATSVSSDGVITLSLPAVQYYAANSYGLGANTMVAAGESLSSTHLYFQNLCGFVVIRLYGEGAVKAITLSGNSAESIAGQANVTPRFGYEPTVAMSESASGSITLDCGEGVELGKTPETATAFWFALPPVSFARGFNIKVFRQDGWSMEQSTSLERTVERNTVHRLSSLETVFTTPPDGEVAFADKSLEAYCLEQFDADGDGNLSLSEAAAVQTLRCSGKGIETMGDLSCFSGLDTLICSQNQLSLLDVSSLTGLIYLDCSNNQLTSLVTSAKQSSAPSTKAESKGDSAPAALTTLLCHYNNLTSLDVSGYPELTNLQCNNNSLTSLDVSGNPVLGRLFFRYNQISAIDVSKNPVLFYLDCMANLLTSLDVSNNPQLSTLDFTQNQVSEIDVSKNPVLSVFHFTSNNITTLDLSHNPELKQLNCSDNPLITLDLSHNPALEVLMCYKIGLTSLDLSGNPILRSISCRENNFTSLNFRYNPKLTSISCPINKLTALDISQCADLTSLSFYGNQLATIDVSNNTKLTSLDCGDNQLTTIDVSNNTKLTMLDCGGNLLAALDVSKNTDLKSLYCNNNLLTVLDVSNNLLLTRLTCNNNPYLTEIWLREGQVINSLTYDTYTSTIKYKANP
ncbi:MAG: leucine-rich repeat domain-containing protein [Bacteroidales bacterium]|nr:leucine-rich repeat domain-containing protein [Bacteroidales bacterium]